VHIGGPSRASSAGCTAFVLVDAVFGAKKSSFVEGRTKVEQAITAGGDAAFVRVQFDWTGGGERLRSTYVVIYRYCDGRIAH
jgi:hypothetical protein